MSFLRHRHLIYLPFLVLLLGTVIAGQFNSVDAHGVVVDSSTGEPVKGVSVAYGNRATLTDDQGRYDLLNLPRGAMLSARTTISYGPASAPAEATKIELPPLTLNLQVNEKGTQPAKGVKSPQARQGDKVLGTGTETGSMVVVPYPEIGSKILICATGYKSADIEARGVQQTVELEVGASTDGCPPLPSPSPSAAPSGSPAGSPTPPAPSPTPSPTATP